jgi:hypothetical protein
MRQFLKYLSVLCEEISSANCFRIFFILPCIVHLLHMESCLSSQINGRVVIHVDMDCFYAQVEHRRLKIPNSQPLAVQQWDGLIAVNYAARAKGITRHMRVQVNSSCKPTHYRTSVDCFPGRMPRRRVQNLSWCMSRLSLQRGQKHPLRLLPMPSTPSSPPPRSQSPNPMRGTRPRPATRCARARARTHANTHAPL